MQDISGRQQIRNMARPRQDTPPWWDREFDDTGAPIRADVRQAAQGCWPQAYNRVRSVLGDPSDAAELMEAAVAHISRYLDRHSIPLFASETIPSLLMLHFSQELRRHAGKLRRTAQIKDEDIDQQPVPIANWDEAVNRQIDLQRLCLLLSKRSCAIMGMRLLGRTWEKIADRLGISPSAARYSFWHEVREAKVKLKNATDPPG